MDNEHTQETIPVEVVSDRRYTLGKRLGILGMGLLILMFAILGLKQLSENGDRISNPPPIIVPTPTVVVIPGSPGAPGKPGNPGKTKVVVVNPSPNPQPQFSPRPPSENPKPSASPKPSHSPSPSPSPSERVKKLVCNLTGVCPHGNEKSSSPGIKTGVLDYRIYVSSNYYFICYGRTYRGCY